MPASTASLTLYQANATCAIWALNLAGEWRLDYLRTILLAPRP